MAYVRNGYLLESESMAADISLWTGDMLLLSPEEIASIQLYSPAAARIGTVYIIGRLNGGARRWTTVHTEIAALNTVLDIIVNFPHVALREVGVAYTAGGGAGLLTVDSAIKGLKF